MLAEVNSFPPGVCVQEEFFMETETQVQKEKSGFDFFRNFGWIIAAVCGLISILFLLGTIIKVELESGVVANVHLWDYFQGKNDFDWSMYITIAFLAIGVIFSILKKFKNGFGSGASMLFILSIPMLALSSEFFKNNDSFNNEAINSVEFGWASACAIAFAIIAALISLSTEVNERPISVRDIAEEGILIAAAFILNLIKIPVASGGGSINFQMLPLFLIALRHGPAHGLICGGIIYGLLTCLTDGWGFATYPFDYLIGFGSVMVMGYFSRFILSEYQKWYNIKGELFLLLAGVLATLIRFIGSCASSMIVYGVDLAGAVSYNIIYITVSGAIAIAIIMLAYGPLLKIHHRFPLKKSL